ncbi:MAG: hypothetical protein JSU86_20340 [Phycisphaerales bacterium]|nr:MAG: hypothetical protein JSU86_20340 [Phycisphaerales bacterium]
MSDEDLAVNEKDTAAEQDEEQPEEDARQPEQDQGQPAEELSEEEQAMAKLKEAISVEKEEIGPLRLKLTVTVPQDTLDERRGEQFAELKRDLLVPGFRGAQAPGTLSGGNAGFSGEGVHGARG